MQYELQIFEYEDQTRVRIIDIDGNPWFVASDVCRALDIKNVSDAVSRLADDEKGIGNADTLGGYQEALIVSESGLYALIFRSRKPTAQAFRKWVTQEVLPSIRRTGAYAKTRQRTPAFIRRFNENWDRTSAGYFSVISELTIRLWGRMEKVGYTMADRAADGTELRPDVSVGRRFADWLREYHPDVSNDYQMYLHWTPDGEFEAREYPNAHWHLFVRFVDMVWIPKCALEYFKSRDPAALPYLPKLLAAASPQPRLTGKRPANQGRKNSA